MAAEREDEIAAITEAARRARPSSPRWLWILAVLVGLACAVAFVIVLALGGDDPPRATPGAPSPSAAPSRLGFGTGLVLGLGAGIAIGFALARQPRDHSSRSSP